MKYFFVLGRNPSLSEAELLSYFEKEQIRTLSHKLKSNAIVVDVDNELKLKEMMNELGGVIAGGRVIFSGEVKKISEEIRKKPIYFGRDNKVVYSVLDYANEEDFSEILDAIKFNFREERLKARYKGVSGTIKLQNGDVVQGSPEKIVLRDMNYFVFSDDENKYMSFGCIEASYDSSEAEKKDMQKPYRREELAISPRLARILINLSQTKKKETLVDPFCGIGVILGEAMLKGINVVGIEIERNAANNARQNIEWLRKNYKVDSESKVINDDSRKSKIQEFSGIATEPSLGELMTKLPARNKAESITSEFEELIIAVINNIKKYMKRGGKIAFTSPMIKSQRGSVSCNFERICYETRMRLYEIKNSNIKFPIKEFRREQIVGREIAVLSF